METNKHMMMLPNIPTQLMGYPETYTLSLMLLSVDLTQTKSTDYTDE
jgi:hypothetical protein